MPTTLLPDPGTWQERERDYHATQARTWIKFARQAEPGTPGARHADDQAHHHTAQAGHWQRLEEHRAAWRTYGNGNDGAELRRYYAARPELRPPWQPIEPRPWR